MSNERLGFKSSLTELGPTGGGRSETAFRSGGFLYYLGDMKRWGLLILALILIAVAATVIHIGRARRAQNKREAAYQSALRSYSEVLRPGMTRMEVEDYLRGKGLTFQQMCCVAEHRGAYDDLWKIGQEDAPWFCSEQNIYVALEFSGVEPRLAPKAGASATLRKVSIFRWFEGCL